MLIAGTLGTRAGHTLVRGRGRLDRSSGARARRTGRSSMPRMNLLFLTRERWLRWPLVLSPASIRPTNRRSWTVSVKPKVRALRRLSGTCRRAVRGLTSTMRRHGRATAPRSASSAVGSRGLHDDAEIVEIDTRGARRATGDLADLAGHRAPSPPATARATPFRRTGSTSVTTSGRSRELGVQRVLAAGGRQPLSRARPGRGGGRRPARRPHPRPRRHLPRRSRVAHSAPPT